MPTVCFQPIYGKRIRVTSLTECGALPAPETENVVSVTDGFISVRIAAEVESATEIITKKADGSLCVNERTNPSFKYFTVEIDFCGVNPGLLAQVTNAEEYEISPDTVGGIVVPEGTIDKRFSLELWTGLTGACEPGAETASGYLLLPFVNGGTMGNLEFNGESSVTFSLTNSSTRGGNAWGVGPFDVISDGTDAAPLPTPLDPGDHMLLITTTIAPPPSECGLQAMPALAGGGETED